MRISTDDGVTGKREEVHPIARLVHILGDLPGQDLGRVEGAVAAQTSQKVNLCNPSVELLVRLGE